jgi:hypothetical protein
MPAMLAEVDVGPTQKATVDVIKTNGHAENTKTPPSTVSTATVQPVSGQAPTQNQSEPATNPTKP